MSDTTGNYLSQEALPTNSASTGKKRMTENLKWDGSDRHKAVKDGMSGDVQYQEHATTAIH